jgi:hypothetical protein
MPFRPSSFGSIAEEQGKLPLAFGSNRESYRVTLSAALNSFRSEERHDCSFRDFTLLERLSNSKSNVPVVQRIEQGFPKP